MAEGIKLLRKLQLGIETTAGTAVAATTIWRGEGVLEDTRETVFPAEDVGYLSQVDRSYVPKLGGALALVSTPATFEQIPYILAMGVEADAPAQDGTAGSGYLYAYEAPTTAVPTISTYTIEGGDNIDVREMEYVFCKDFTIEGAGGQALMVSANLEGRQVSTSTFTTTATLPAIEETIFGKGKVYIDAVSGTAGTTQVSNTILGVSFKYNTGLTSVYTADGATYFSFVKCAGPEVLLDLTFEHNSNATTEIAAWKAQTPRQIVLTFEGTALTTAGTYTYKTFKITLSGKWEKFSALGDQDGNNIVTGTFRARYNATSTKFCEFLVVNSLSALP